MFSTEHSNTLQSHFESPHKEGGSKVVSYITDSTMPLEENREPENPLKYGWRFIGVFACLCILNLVCAIDATILAVALPVSVIAFLSEHCPRMLSKLLF